MQYHLWLYGTSNLTNATQWWGAGSFSSMYDAERAASDYMNGKVRGTYVFTRTRITTSPNRPTD